MMTVNKNIKSIGVSLILMLLGACSSDFIDLQDPNAVASATFYKNENDVLLGVNGIYQSLRSGNSIGENSGMFFEERSDNTGRNDNQSSSGEPFQFNDFSLLPSNAYLKNHWDALYESVSRTNQVLEGMEKVTFSNNNLKAQYEAEARFVRGLMYFHLVRKWGAVPLVTKTFSTMAEVEAATFRSEEPVVYDQIVTDLKYVVDSPLPNLPTAESRGRVSKAAGNALLGQVYLTMATTLPGVDKSAYLSEAHKYLLAAYQMRNFGFLKEIPYQDVFDVNKKTTCPELIFQIVNKQGDINYSSSIARNNQARGETINSLFASTGLGGNVKPDLVKDYEQADLRKAFSIKFADHASVKDYFITKYRDNSEAAGSTGYGGNDWILMRYADVILMLAEVNMLLGNDVAAIGYLDQVRERAGLSPYSIAKNTAAYQAAYPTLKLAILHERRVELAFENHRWFDLLRFFTTPELVNYFQSKSQADYGVARLSNFGEKDRYFPIPFDEYKLNPEKMYQNKGY
ncbi:RagB/SusD family nutrient uptake outer membrane protein [Dyadobacter tibetensis]|uniref:RagB/SusD family nutrient uptake outer membrane protein n=1 Tax=Dyadobacter tibetensis TaxID=1211851 RepID=UPI0004B00D18|nr:RagB/SusD family nutrient uptake outer membrane protein [Dyadobacter tibetensis]